jgi:two-component system, NarL family, sensor kinase
MIQLRNLILATGAILLLCTKLEAQDIGGSIVSGYKERKDKALIALNRFTKADINRVNALVDLMTTGFIQKQREELLPYHEEAITLSRKLDYARGLAVCYIWKGNYFRGIKKMETAHLFYDSAIQLGRDSYNNDLLKFKADGHRAKAWIYYEQENYYTALNHFFEALKYYESRNSNTAMNIYTMITIIYSRVNNFQQAIVYATKNVTLADQGVDTAMQLQAYLSLVEIYIGNNELVPAINYLNKMKPYMPDPVQLMLNSGYYMNWGLVYFKQQQYDSSLVYYQQAYTVASGTRHDENKTTALYYLSKNALKLGKLDAAKKYADENLLLAKEMNAKIGKINALLNLSDYYHQTNNNTTAFNLLEKAAALKDSLLAEANINQINTLAAVYESDKKENEIIQLQTEKQIQAGVVQQKSILNKLFILAIVVLLFFIYLGYTNFKKGQQIAKQQQALQQQKIIELEKNKQLLTIDAMLKGQEEERSRIAKDLHDGLGSLLSGTKLSFMNVKEAVVLSTENKILFEKSLSMLDNTIGDLRKVAQNLMPEALVKFGLHEALRDFCDAIQSSSGIKLLYQQFGEKRKLNNTAEIFTYRIVQELVNNAVKHAEASEILVQLAIGKIKTGITVEDNGKGYDKTILTHTKGAGQANINYRVQYFNGTCDIVTSPGKGTSVSIELTV